MIGGVSDDGRFTISCDTLGDWQTVEDKMQTAQWTITDLIDYASAVFEKAGMMFTKDGDREVHRGVVADVEAARWVIARYVS